MANLPETPQWEEGIYQIEVSDPVLGGPDGISNRQGKQLASRTLYLKQQVEKGGSDLAKHIAAADPHTQYAPKASPTFTGTPTAPTPANSDNSNKLATTEFVAKALAALAGSAPETLDTLKELADALGNDPNFATTVLTKLSEKLAKDQNGADIPDPALFVKNLGLMDSTGYQGRLLNVKVFRTSGTYTPTQGTKKIRFQAWGGGASGAATQITSGNAASSGGGGAAYIEGYIPVSADTKFAATVGAGGGSVQPGTTNGINGGITALGNLFTMTAAGGGGATFNGYGGTVSANSSGYPELVVIHAYPGGNAMGGISENVGGYGGASFGSAPSNPHTTAGEPNYLPGGGGAGGATTGGTSGASGSGGAGMIIVWEYA